MVNVGDKSEMSRVISESDVEAFAELTCDFNPIHLDPDYAKSTIFGKPICHGSLVSSKFSKILATDLPGPGTILISQEIKFQKPIYWGEEIDIVVEVIGDLGANKFKLQTQAINQEGSIAVDGHAIVKRL